MGLALAATGAATAWAGAWGTFPHRAAPAYAHPTLFDGAGWQALSLQERELLVQGFLIGAAAGQAAALEDSPRTRQDRGRPGGDQRAAAADRSDAGGTSPADLAREARWAAAVVDSLRASGELRFSLAPALLARRVDEFYWWRDSRSVPLAGALGAVHDRLRPVSTAP